MSSVLSSFNVNLNKIDKQVLQAIEDILNYVESSIDSNVELKTSIFNLKQTITELKGQIFKSNSGMIHASVSELKGAFYKHYTTKNNLEDISSYLLLFYAIECGLKSIYLKRNKLTSTARIQNQMLLSKDGHNFEVWIKELRVPPTIYNLSKPEIPYFRLKNRGSSSWDIGKAHQAWRYGVYMNSDDQDKVVKWLEDLCKWIKENINR